MICAGTMDLEEFETELRALIGRPTELRPLDCEGSPLEVRPIFARYFGERRDEPRAKGKMAYC